MAEMPLLLNRALTQILVHICAFSLSVKTHSCLLIPTENPVEITKKQQRTSTKRKRSLQTVKCVPNVAMPPCQTSKLKRQCISYEQDSCSLPPSLCSWSCARAVSGSWWRLNGVCLFLGFGSGLPAVNAAKEEPRSGCASTGSRRLAPGD